MAVCIPERLPRNASEGESRLFRILSCLPDDVIVYYEPVIDNRYPDFVVILPALGVLIIEVKGWSPKEVREADSQSVRLWQRRREVLKNHPLRQVRGYKFALMDRCREDRRAEDLIQRDGAHQGGFKFPFGSFAVLSRITREQLAAVSGSETIFPPSHVATSDRLDEWELLTPDALVGVLYGYFDPRWEIERMTANQVNIIKAILHPEILLRLDYDKNGKSEDPKVSVLDLKQETVARNIGGGHRLVFGVAGSGKTVILVARAKLISRLNPAARILVLCFNIPLSAMLAEALKQQSSTVTVCHFDGWAKINNVTREFKTRKDNALLGRKLLAALTAGAPDTGKFDVVLIDEAQDFSPEWYMCVLKAMKDPVNGELLIVGDGSQGVYGRRKVSWKQLGIQAQGRTRYLDRNYRNTRPILELASLFSDKDTSPNDDCLRAIHVDPANAIRVSGFKPVLMRAKSPQDESARTLQVVNDLLRGKWFGHDIEPLKPHEIGILYRFVRKQDRGQIDDFRKQLSKLGASVQSVWLNESTESKRRVGEPGIKIMTMHAAKGLQFLAVIMFASHDCPLQIPGTDPAEERRLFLCGPDSSRRLPSDLSLGQFRVYRRNRRFWPRSSGLRIRKLSRSERDLQSAQR